MRLEIDESIEICNWLLDNDLGLDECAHVLSDVECGDTFGLALLKVFKYRKLTMEKLHEKFPTNFNDPITD